MKERLDKRTKQKKTLERIELIAETEALGATVESKILEWIKLRDETEALGATVESRISELLELRDEMFELWKLQHIELDDLRAAPVKRWWQVWL